VAGITFTLIGLDELRRNMEALQPRMEHAVKQALYEEAQELRTDAMEHCPVDTGTLRDSHYATLPEQHGDAIVTEIGAGGPAKGYAIPVHERTELRHKVGEAKWLENAYKRRAAGFTERFASRVKYHFERDSGPPRQAPGVPTDPGV